MRKKKKIFNRVINHNPHGFYNTVQRKLSQAAYAKDVVEIAKKAFKCRNNVAFFLGGVSKFYPKIVPLNVFDTVYMEYRRKILMKQKNGCYV